MEAIKDFFINHFTHEVAVAILSMLPIVELRGAIPVGVALSMPYRKTFLLSFIGSSIPAFFIIWLIGYIFLFLRRINFFDRLINKITIRTMKRRDQIDKYGYLGLFLFVAIPLPGTGVWTGSLLSHLLGMNKLKSLVAVILGNLTAGIIVLSISAGIGVLF